MTVQSPFMPSYGQGAIVAPNGTSASSVIGDGSKTLLLTNLGATGSLHILPGEGFLF
jgi:hypothetical protein